MHTTNYTETFITVSPDSDVEAGIVPPKAGSIAQLQHALIAANPYAMTSDDVLFAVYAKRSNIADVDLEDARVAFFEKPQACLRASPLVKQFGWGLHHDAEGKVALVDVASERYRELLKRDYLKIRPGMRSKRA